MGTAARHPFQRGFTVIELLTVLALAGVILGLAIPRYSGLLGDLRLQSATSTLVLDLRRAQGAAGASGGRVLVSFGDHAYTVQRRGTAAVRTGLPRGVTVKAVNASRVIWFAANGTSSGGFVTLAGPTGSTTVVVTAARGLAYVMPEAAR